MGKKPPIIYLDNCVYNRPFDDQNDPRIFLEAMAFFGILRLIENGAVESINSDILEFENSRIADPERKLRISTFLSAASRFIKISSRIIERAEALENLGFSGMDSLHMASAESSRAVYFITCDDGIVKKARRHKSELNIDVLTVLQFTGEIMYDNSQ